MKKEGIPGTKIQYEGHIDELENILENRKRERYLKTKNFLIKTNIQILKGELGKGNGQE
ncbi:hypothetical protein [Priestia megaterium]|uniref:hypothetical protein n=1 Tax=Priestia megaterium TaxID=1404 RepID=UPI001374B85D|nr:hypothetical protein [Priestia megaterium]MDH3168761.1 hypothetical protein [Priestia megaterium]